jgi:riboflavin biosynthesis pyrimidine reductase
VLLTGSDEIPQHSHVLANNFKDRTVIMRGKDIAEVPAELGKRNVLTVLIEGGDIILGQAFREKPVNEVYWYIAPRLSGVDRSSPAEPALPISIELDHVTVRPMVNNVFVHGFLVWKYEPYQA